MINWHTLVRHLCECGNTYPDKLSVKLCTHDNLEDKTMPRNGKGAPKTTERKPKAKKPVGFTQTKPKKRKTKVS